MSFLLGFLLGKGFFSHRRRARGMLLNEGPGVHFDVHPDLSLPWVSIRSSTIRNTGWPKVAIHNGHQVQDMRRFFVEEPARSYSGRPRGRGLRRERPSGMTNTAGRSRERAAGFQRRNRSFSCFRGGGGCIVTICVHKHQRSRTFEKKHDLPCTYLWQSDLATLSYSRSSQLSRAALCRLAMLRAGCPGRSASSITMRVKPVAVKRRLADQRARSANRWSIISVISSTSRKGRRRLDVNERMPGEVGGAA